MWEWPRHCYAQNTVAEGTDSLSKKAPALFPSAKLPEADGLWKAGQAASRGVSETEVIRWDAASGWEIQACKSLQRLCRMQQVMLASAHGFQSRGRQRHLLSGTYQGTLLSYF